MPAGSTVQTGNQEAPNQPPAPVSPVLPAVEQPHVLVDERVQLAPGVAATQANPRLHNPNN